MFLWLLSANLTYKIRLRHRILFRDKKESRSLAIASSLSEQALNYARATNGYVYMATGLDPMIKWDGNRNETVRAGVAAPTEAIVLGGAGTGEIIGALAAFMRFIDRDGNPSNLSPISNIFIAENLSTITYDNVETSDDPKIVRRQILRNRSGEALVFYVDIDTLDMDSVSFSSNQTDADLLVAEGIPLFDDDGNPLANRFGIPPDDKTALLYYLDRLWAAGEVRYDRGHVELTAGSTTVAGVGTHWTESFAGRFLYVAAGERIYEIDSVNVPAQTLELTTEYRAVTDLFAEYVIRPAPAQSHLLQFTEPGFFDAWSALNALVVGDPSLESDHITGLLTFASFLFLLKRRSVYRITFQKSPGIDGGVFEGCRRGCANNRCWQIVNGRVYMLDENGIYRFDGSEAVEDISAPIQNVFWPQQDLDEPRINWRGEKFFHSNYDGNRATIRWFVSLTRALLPRHALCFNHQTETWWIEEYPFAVGASTSLELRQSVPLCGADNIYSITNEGLEIAQSEMPGRVTDAGIDWLEDDLRSFPDSLVGTPLALTLGRSKGQIRMITEVAGSRLTVKTPFTELPVANDEYQVGGIPWKWRSGWFTWTSMEQSQVRRAELAFEPQAVGRLNLQVFENHSKTPNILGPTVPSTESEASGVSLSRGGTDIVFDMTDSGGFAQARMDDMGELYSWSGMFVSLAMNGFTGKNGIRIYQLVLDGVEEEGK